MNGKDTGNKRTYPVASGAGLDIDATGLLCPLPVLRLRKALAAALPGTRICLRATDPASRIDVPHFCNESGHRLIEAGEENGAFIYLVEAT